MGPKHKNENPLKQLQSLAGDPDRQAACAIALLQPGARHDVLLAVLRVLAEHPSVEAHEPLLAVYRHLASDGTKRDPGAYVRSAALNALRPILLISDTPLLLQAVDTFEYLPPGFGEEASALRAAALLALNELNDETTSYYAARFLIDGQMAQMSGEPALTAVRVLASRNELVPLYQYVMQSTGLIVADVSSECLRHLTALPVSLLPGVVTAVDIRSSPIESVGLFDLLIGHESGPQMLDYIAAYLSNPHDLDVYRYLILTALTARRDELTCLLCEAAQDDFDERRRDILIEALEPFVANEQVSETLKRIRRS